MNRSLLGLVALLTIAAAPATPLVAGVVRDQLGYPIDGALVEARQGATTIATRTAPDGSFALESSATHVTIRCAYCARTTARVASDGTVVAIVTRYARVADTLPSAAEIARLPYANVESDLSLAPFVVLAQSSRTIPGPSLGDRSALPGLLVLDGVPDYDVAAGVTPYDTIVQRSTASLGVARADESSAYGDVASFGTFEVDTTGDRGAAFALGDDRSARVAAANGNASLALASSDAVTGDRRARVAGDVRVATPGLDGTLALGAGDADVTPVAQSALASSFSSLRANLRTARGIDAATTFVLDRGTYAYTSSKFPSSASWSDADLRVDVQSHATVAPFATFELRNSAGWYGAANPATALAAAIEQTRYVGGLRTVTSWFDATAALGHDDVGYLGGYAGAPPAATGATDGVASIDLHPRGGWTLHASTSSGYALQTLLGYYGPNVPDAVTPVDQLATNEATLGYGDDARVRVGLTALATRAASGFASSSDGAFVAWQLAPNVSVRSWYLALHQSNATRAYVGSTWMTYERPGGLRLDAIWRRDLYDGAPRGHLDLAISGVLEGRIAWYAASEVRGLTRATSLGLRF